MAGAEKEEKKYEKKLARAAQTKTLFRLQGDAANDWRTLNAIGDKALVWLKNKYGARLVQIYGQPLMIAGQP